MIHLLLVLLVDLQALLDLLSIQLLVTRLALLLQQDPHPVRFVLLSLMDLYKRPPSELVQLLLVSQVARVEVGHLPWPMSLLVLKLQIL